MSNFYTVAHVRGNKIYLRGYDSGRKVQEIIEYKPYLFIKSKKDSPFKTLNGESVSRIDFDSIRDVKNFTSKYDNIENFEYFDYTFFLYQYLYDTYPGEIKYDPGVVSVVTIDIEVASDAGFPDIQLANKPITAITYRKNNESVVFGCSYYKPKSNDVTYVLCKDEKDLLQKFITLWSHKDWIPDIVTGWNVEFFDIPYIVNRINVVLGQNEAKRLSPWKILEERMIDIRGTPSQTYVPLGVVVLDYLHLYKKFSFSNHESYRLDHIANVELGEKKIDYSEYDSLLDLYKNDFEKFIDYNIHDVTLVHRLEEKLGLIQQVMALAYDAKVNYVDTLTTVRPWDVIIRNYLMDKKIVIPQFTPYTDPFEFVGGYVKPPQVGMHKWVVSFDLNSLYPHLIMQYNISPETFIRRHEDFYSIDELLNADFKIHKAGLDGKSEVAFAANGCTYRRDKQGFLPEIMEKMYNDRVLYKQKMIEAKKKYEETKDKELQKDIARYHNMQLAKKIQLNSAYGALGNRYFRWFSVNNAEAITMSGQLSIRWIEKKINKFMNKMLKSKSDYVLASDTDSIYVNMGPVVNAIGKDLDDLEIVKIIDEFCEKKIQPFIDKSYQELADMMNAYQQKMQMKRENISNKGIWKAKKMYILNVWNSEGVQYSEPKLKMMGIEAVRSSTPQSVRDNIKKALDIIMNKDEETLQQFIYQFREKFNTLKFEEIAFPRGVKGLPKYKDSANIYKKGTPIHVKGALLYNKLILEKGIQSRYQPISDGDKIKFSYLKMPNPLKDTVISVPGALPAQFGLDNYIDYDLQFEKSFLAPIKSILDVIDWRHEQTSTLEDFFS